MHKHFFYLIVKLSNTRWKIMQSKKK